MKIKTLEGELKIILGQLLNDGQQADIDKKKFGREFQSHITPEQRKILIYVLTTRMIGKRYFHFALVGIGIFAGYLIAILTR
jgi:hypothetical protein